MHSSEENFGEPEYLGWTLLVRLKLLSDDQISRSKFLKLCCITDRYLVAEFDYDVGLPRYWYMYGELTNEHEFGGRFYNAPKAIGWEGQQYLPKQSLRAEDFDVDDEARELIHRGVERTVQEFGTSNVEEIKRYQYQEHHPNDFIPAYSQLRWHLKTIDLGSQQRLATYTSRGQSNEEFLTQLLDEMVVRYPEDDEDFQEMYSLYLRWDDTARLLLEETGDYGEVEEFLDDFIEILSKVVLRFKYGYNISENRLKNWQKEADRERSRFRERLREKRQDLLRGRTRSATFDELAEVFSETVRDDIERLSVRE